VQLARDLDDASRKLALEAEAGQQARISARELNETLKKSIQESTRSPRVNFLSEEAPGVTFSLATSMDRAFLSWNQDLLDSIAAGAVTSPKTVVDEFGQPLQGRSHFDRWATMGGILDSDLPFGEKVAKLWRAFDYVVPDVEQRRADRQAAEAKWSQIDRIEGSPIGATFFAIANISGADQRTQELMLNLGVSADGLMLSTSGLNGRSAHYWGAQTNVTLETLVPMRGPVEFFPVRNASVEQLADLQLYVDSANRALSAGYLSPSGRVSTQGRLSVEAQFAADAERARAESANQTIYSGKVVGHGPDTTWTGKPQAFEWIPLDSRVNSSVAGQVLRYPIGYQPTKFVVIERP